MKRRSVGARLKIDDDVLTIVLHPGYLMLQATRRGHPQWLHTIYIPRSRLVPLMKWLVKALRTVEADEDFYVPTAERVYYAGIQVVEDDQRRQKREREAQQRSDDQRNRQRRRFLAARRRAKRRSGT